MAPLSEDAKAVLRILVDSQGSPVGYLDVSWDKPRWDLAIGEIRAAGVDVKDDSGSH